MNFKINLSVSPKRSAGILIENKLNLWISWGRIANWGSIAILTVLSYPC